MVGNIKIKDMERTQVKIKGEPQIKAPIKKIM